MRQYSKLKSEKGKAFSYKDLRKVYTIVFYEQSIEEFKKYDSFVHHAKMVCDTGLELNFLQEFYLVALDVFRKSEYAKGRDSKERLAGWLSFFCTETVEEAEALCAVYPWLSEIYVEMAEFGRKPEELMTMFSEMLREMDRNTIRYMVDDMKEQIEKGKAEYAELQEMMEDTRKEITEMEGQLAGMKGQLNQTNEQLNQTNEQLTETKGQLTETQGQLTVTKGQLTETQGQLTETQGQLTEMKDQLTEARASLAEKDAEIARLKALLANG